MIHFFTILGFPRLLHVIRFGVGEFFGIDTTLFLVVRSYCSSFEFSKLMISSFPG